MSGSALRRIVDPPATRIPQAEPERKDLEFCSSGIFERGSYCMGDEICFLPDPGDCTTAQAGVEFPSQARRARRD